MEGQLALVQKLIEECERFNFENFATLRFAVGYSRDPVVEIETPEWRIFKVRMKNLIFDIASDRSPAKHLLAEGLSYNTEGFGSQRFEQIKSNFMKALEVAKCSLEDDVYGEIKSAISQSESPILSNKVFVVHGRDQSLKTDTERFLLGLGLIPVVLHREVDQGKTIIEKFEQHSDVGYAFILLTPDEISFPSIESDLEDSCRAKKYRARPNVIFEFGYFIGKLGRDRVCCLHKGNVEVPSDIDGLVYKKVDESIDSQGWAIVKELKAAGYQINM